MGQRGRKSANELADSNIASIERPTPPEWMSEAEKAEWNEIVRQMPPDWMTRERYSHLEALCTHSVARRFAAEKYDEAMKMDAPDPNKVKKWSDIHSTESGKIQSLGIRLDIAQSTSYEQMKRNGKGRNKALEWKDRR